MSSYEFKVVLLGQSCVGKTSLALRYISNVFNETHQSTLPASFLKKQLYLEKDLVRLNIWDTAGQEKFHSLGPIYYREANGALLVYDVTNPDSLSRVRDWIKELNKMLGIKNVLLAIVGNKTDLLAHQSNGSAILNGTIPGSTLPSMDEAETLARQSALIQEAIRMTDELQNAQHYLTSAKNNHGIAETFLSLARRMVEHYKKSQSVYLDPRVYPSRLRITPLNDNIRDAGGQYKSKVRANNRSLGMNSSSSNSNNNNNISISKKNNSCAC